MREVLLLILTGAMYACGEAEKQPSEQENSEPTTKEERESLLPENYQTILLGDTSPTFSDAIEN